jgi:hypothetical protein
MTNSFNSLPTPESNEKLNLTVMLRLCEYGSYNINFSKNIDWRSMAKSANFLDIKISKPNLDDFEQNEEIALYYLDQVVKAMSESINQGESNLNQYSFEHIKSNKIKQTVEQFYTYFGGYKIFNSKSTIDLDKEGGLKSIMSNVPVGLNIDFDNLTLLNIEEIKQKIVESQNYDVIFPDKLEIEPHIFYNGITSSWCVAFICPDMLEKSVDNDFPDVFDIVLEAATGDEIDRLYRTQ